MWADPNDNKQFHNICEPPQNSPLSEISVTLFQIPHYVCIDESGTYAPQMLPYYMIVSDCVRTREGGTKFGKVRVFHTSLAPAPHMLHAGISGRSVVEQLQKLTPVIPTQRLPFSIHATVDWFLCLLARRTTQQWKKVDTTRVKQLYFPSIEVVHRTPDTPANGLYMICDACE